MRKYLFILFIFISQNCFSQSGWFWQNPLPQGHNINRVKFINSITGYAVGDCGTILKSTDAGTSWSIMLNIFPVELTDVFTVGDNTCYSVGYYNTYPETGAIIKTTNGGSNWNYLPHDSTKEFIVMYFINENSGYFGGNNGRIYSTTDGGVTLLNKSINSSYSIGKLFFTDLNNGCGLVRSNSSVYSILRTSDGGSNWSEVSVLGIGFFSSIYFINSNTGFVAGNSNPGLLYMTTNGGLNWTIKESLTGLSAQGVQFINSSTGFIWASGNINTYFYKTTNSGLNWLLEGYTANEFSTILFADENHAYATQSYGYGIARSSDAGLNWILPPSPEVLDGHNASFVNNNTGYVSSVYNSITKTTNGGINWNTFQLENPFDINSIFFLNADTGFVAGVSRPNPYWQDPKLYSTTNGGLNWNVQASQLFNTISFRNSSTGYGARYSVFKTTNEGQNWTQQVSLPGLATVIQFVNDLTGYVTGQSGVFYKTTNGGYNWTDNRISYYNISDFHFFNASTGIVLEVPPNATYIRKTTDGGMTWNLVLVNTTFLYSLSFINEQTGYAVGLTGGNTGAYFKTTNGGLNWFNASLLSCRQLNKIIFTDSNTGYIFGDNSVLLKTTNGGNPIGIEKIHSQIPEGFVLHQNYPNPFNPVTKIKFEIPSSSFQIVVLKIYDITGRELTTLLNEKLQPGVYDTDWDGTNFASGVYFYQLIAGDFTETKKMVLIK